MATTVRALWVWLAALPILLCGCALSSTDKAASTAGSATMPRITVLYDAFGKPSAMKKDWGYAALVEVGGKRILFDTGDDPDVFAQNVKTAGVDLRRLDFVVLSHRHSDHMGGLTTVLSANPDVKIYAPKEGFGIYGSDLPSSFYRKNEALPPEMRYYDGQPPAVMKFGKAWPRANIELVDKTTQVAPGVTLIALVSDAPGTKELKELSLAVQTPEGLVLVVGCSHPGIEAIVAEATKIDARIRLVTGGFHLLLASLDTAVPDRIAAALHDTYKVQWVAPGHCTGEYTFAALQKAFGARYLYAGLGTVLELGAEPRARFGGEDALAMEASDLQSYRHLLATSDDAPDPRAMRVARGR